MPILIIIELQNSLQSGELKSEWGYWQGKHAVGVEEEKQKEVKKQDKICCLQGFLGILVL